MMPDYLYALYATWVGVIMFRVLHVIVVLLFFVHNRIVVFIYAALIITG